LVDIISAAVLRGNDCVPKTELLYKEETWVKSGGMDLIYLEQQIQSPLLLSMEE
jgi:hypothetical protein